MLHYFLHDQDIAAVEDAGQAAKHAAAGWRKTGRAEFMEAWAMRDARALARLWEGVEGKAAETAADGGAFFPGPAVERWRAPWLLMEIKKEGK